MGKALQRRIDSAALTAFRDAFPGEVVVPGDREYDAARVVWNGIADRHPAIVARCAGPADVAAALPFARDQDLVVAVRGGGHSVAGFSTCDGGMVIDLSRMRGVSVDPERRIARVAGGTLLGELDREAQAFGLATPVGVVAHTGVGGLTLGGGMGRLQRKLGFTIDNLLSVDIVTADGREIHVDEQENDDLFWGVRGAGANFGVVTSFEFRLHPVGPMITQGMVLLPIERAHDVAGVFRELAGSAPDDVMISMGFGVATPEAEFPPEVAGRPIVLLGATHSGSLEAAERDLEPLHQLDPVLDTFGPKSYLTVQNMSDEAMAWGKRFYMKGAFMQTLSDEAVNVCAEQVTSPPGDCSVSLWAQGGAIARVPETAMAFTGRQAPFWLGVEALWGDEALDGAHIAWGRAAMDALKPFTGSGHYVNDVVESGVEVVRAIYGDAKYERLVRLKRAYDPDNVFRLNQNIAP
jgi:FAD/FMN-containing dehydrogenase